jgi:UDP-glucuronate 4-epimerase
MKTVLVTGAAGFIGSHVAQALLSRGDHVVGLDNLNDYYDVGLKQARLDRLTIHDNFTFRKMDIAERESVITLASDFPHISYIVHLAAQPGVRYSLTNPYVYISSNVMGQIAMQELARTLKALEHFVYASSSSVYGSNTKLPFSIDDPVQQPNSVYAATKRMDELLGHCYAQLHGIPATGLRLFTVYGPWGRPDMAPMIFARAIVEGTPIRLFNHGEMWRDFTYVDDIVNGVVRALERIPSRTPPHAVYNLGNNKSEKLTDFVAALEAALGRKARLEMLPMQPGEMMATYADIEASRRDLGFEPIMPISLGIPKFIAWFRTYYGL